MKVDIEKRLEEVAVTRDEEVFHLELSMREAIIVLMAMSYQTRGNLIDKYSKAIKDEFICDNFKEALTKIDSDRIYQEFEGFYTIFNKLAEVIAK